MGLLVAGLSLVACGGDDGGGGDTGEASVSEDEWRDEASELCEEWVEEFDRSAGTEAVAETGEELIEELEDLGPPEEIEDEADDFLDAVDDMVDLVTELGEALDAGELPDGDIIGQIDSAADDVADAGEELDLDCDLSAIGVSDDDGTDDLSDSSDDFSSDFSDDFSSDFSDDIGIPDDEFVPVDPEVFIPEFGTDDAFDELAVQCFDGVMESCDLLYFQTPVSPSESSYEGYGATCGGRLFEPRPGGCVDRFGES